MFLKNKRCYERDNNILFPEVKQYDIDVNTYQNQASNKYMKDNNMMSDPNMGCGCKMDPVIEHPTERCVHRTICHEVPHVCPINTKIINHHVYRHTYQPNFTCCEQNEISHINEGSCCQFR